MQNDRELAAMTDDELNAHRQRAYDLLLSKNYDESRRLFESIFDGSDAAVASCLGIIHSGAGPIYHIGKAERYYRIAAEAGDLVGQYALAGLLKERDETQAALTWYEKASDAGDAPSSYMLSVLYDAHGAKDLAARFLDRAGGCKLHAGWP